MQIVRQTTKDRRLRGAVKAGSPNLVAFWIKQGAKNLIEAKRLASAMNSNGKMDGVITAIDTAIKNK